MGGKPGVTTLDSLMSSLGSVLLMWFVYTFISTKVSRLDRTFATAKVDANAPDCNRTDDLQPSVEMFMKHVDWNIDNDNKQRFGSENAS